VSNGTPYQTATLLAVNPQSAAVGQRVNLGATIASQGVILSRGPAGMVSFRDDGTAIPGCSPQLVNGPTGPALSAAQCSTTFAAGTHNLTATYTPTDPTLWQASVSYPYTLRVAGGSGSGPTGLTGPTTSGEAETITRVRAAPDAGQPELLVYTASVTPAQPSAKVPSGHVAFRDDGVSVAGCGSVALRDGVAVCTTPDQVAGRQEITASYSGDAAFLASRSATTPVTSTISVRAAVLHGPTGSHPTLGLRVTSARISMSGVTILMPAGYTFSVASRTTAAGHQPHQTHQSLRTIGRQLILGVAPAARTVALHIGLRVPKSKLSSHIVYGELRVRYPHRATATLIIAVRVP
jgi:hypothetical protein